MSLCAEGSFTRKATLVLVLALAAAALAPVARAQSSNEPYPKFELFAGYAWMNPGATVAGTKLDAMPKGFGDRKSTRLNSSHIQKSRMPSSA